MMNNTIPSIVVITIFLLLCLIFSSPLCGVSPQLCLYYTPCFSTFQEINSEKYDNCSRGELMIGKILKTMRRENNYTQEQLAELAYLGRSTISDYERMKTDINFETLEKIAGVCNYEIVFINKKDKNKVLTSKNIDRKEI